MNRWMNDDKDTNATTITLEKTKQRLYINQPMRVFSAFRWVTGGVLRDFHWEIKRLKRMSHNHDHCNLYGHEFQSIPLQKPSSSAQHEPPCVFPLGWDFFWSVFDAKWLPVAMADLATKRVAKLQTFLITSRHGLYGHDLSCVSSLVIFFCGKDKSMEFLSWLVFVPSKSHKWWVARNLSNLKKHLKT